jgi:putative two-component system response regulator
MIGDRRILLICDDEAISRDLKEELVVEDGYSVSFEASGERGISALKQNTFDIIIVKCNMLDIEGTEFTKDLKKIDPDCIIIGLLEEGSPEALMGPFDLGIYDFITKPINLGRLALLIKKVIRARSLIIKNAKLIEGLRERNTALEKQNILLAKRIEESTQNLTRLYEDLRSTYMRTIKALAQAIDARDHYTHSHSENVAKFAVTIASELKLSVKDIEIIREACELHDLGKIGIEDSILTKTTSLNEWEWEQIKKHPATGARILEPLTFLNDVIELVRQHHEHYDGSGYPDGRSGEDIVLGARIIHLADAYESMRSARSYRKTPLTKEEAIVEIKMNSGAQFDPHIVEAFLRLADRM